MIRIAFCQTNRLFILLERAEKEIRFSMANARSKSKWTSIATVPDLCPTTAKILTHLISRYHVPLKSCRGTGSIRKDTVPGGNIVKDSIRCGNIGKDSIQSGNIGKDSISQRICGKKIRFTAEIFEKIRFTEEILETFDSQRKYSKRFDSQRKHLKRFDSQKTLLFKHPV